MTTGGWIVMLASVGSVTTLFGWCIWKVIATPGETNKLHSTEDHTPDQE